MSLEIKTETFESLFTCHADPANNLHWPSIFTLPAWMQSWWDTFGADGNCSLLLRSVWSSGVLIGIAPLVRKGAVVTLLGSPDVCDYLDFICMPGKEKDLFTALIPALRREGVEQLTLHSQRPDSAAFSALFTGNSPNGNIRISYCREDESYALPLASNWEAYLAGLSKKQRHEVRRKLRRLENEAENYSYRVIDKPAELEAFIPEFFLLFKENRIKEEFLTPQMEQYFRTLLSAMASRQMARFGLLEIEGTPAAAVFYFIYRNRVYLYNSGFNSAYSSLSAGQLSKILCIRDSIKRGCDLFDFLKGQEVYKSRLGGTAIPIYKIEIRVS